MSGRMSFFVALAAVAVAAGNSFAQEETPAPMPDPVVKLQRQTGAACLDWAKECEAARQSFQARSEVAFLESQLDFEHAIRERAAAIWLASRAYAQSAMDQTSRAQYQGAVNTVQGAFTQAASQHYQNQSQGIQQSIQDLQQGVPRAFQNLSQGLSAAIQNFNQDIQRFEDKPADPQLLSLLMEPTAEAKQKQEAAQDTFNKAAEEARGKCRLALADANRAWKDRVGEIAAQAQNAAGDQSETEAALRKANKMWLATSRSAVEDLKAAFRAAQNKRELQAED